MRISLSEAQKLLEDQGVVAIPTETVYGLAALLKFPSAIQKIYALKNRPANNPLIIHAASQEQLEPFIQDRPEGFDLLAQAFWPGPLTLIVPAQIENVPEIARAGLSTIACRIPNHPLTQQLLKLVGPLVAPSANLSGRPSATAAPHVELDFGLNFPVLDAGYCAQGVESTILSFTDNRWKIARLGAISGEQLQDILGYVPEYEAKGKAQINPICPGQMYRHYAPQAKLHLGTTTYTGSISTVVGYKDRKYELASQVLCLGYSYNPEEVASQLYAILRQLDILHIEEAWIDLNVPDKGLWKTIRERLIKASQR
ncbi:MAG: ywlC [Chlamydiales bacterium]|jgi:L-threonylcarbamoyladenylate synthase|nr:ywlC [Chlamydiales bacterium]